MMTMRVMVMEAFYTFRTVRVRIYVYRKFASRRQVPIQYFTHVVAALPGFIPLWSLTVLRDGTHTAAA